MRAYSRLYSNTAFIRVDPAWWAPLIAAVGARDEEWFTEHPDASERRREAVTGELWPGDHHDLTVIISRSGHKRFVLPAAPPEAAA